MIQTSRPFHDGNVKKKSVSSHGYCNGFVVGFNWRQLPSFWIKEHCLLVGPRLHLRLVQSFRAISPLLQNVFCCETLPQNSSNTFAEFQCKGTADVRINQPKITNITRLRSVSCGCFWEWNCIIIICQGKTVPRNKAQLSTSFAPLFALINMSSAGWCRKHSQKKRSQWVYV